MTTSVLEALIQLFALFAAGRGKKGIAMGRRHASRYMPVSYTHLTLPTTVIV